MRLMKEFLVLNPVHVPADFVEQSRNGVLTTLLRSLANSLALPLAALTVMRRFPTSEDLADGLVPMAGWTGC